MTTQYETFLQNGREILDTYCSCSTDDNYDKHPIMLPRAPQQTYIDVYPDQDQPGCSFKGDKRHQSQSSTHGGCIGNIPRKENMRQRSSNGHGAHFRLVKYLRALSTSCTNRFFSKIECTWTLSRSAAGTIITASFLRSITTAFCT